MLNDIFWYGDYVDFGIFWDFLNCSVEEDVIEFIFKISY